MPVPKPAPHQALIRVKAAGFCHTDLIALNNEFSSTLPFIGSHEPAGIVEEVGAQVTGFQKGDRVGCINFDTVCGKCPDCKANRPIYCDTPKMKGLTADGAWAEYMVAYPEARKEVFSIGNIQSGFRATGIEPYDPKEVLTAFNYKTINKHYHSSGRYTITGMMLKYLKE
ncbi:chaperonin 10-like protein [Aspergillus heterothallicus]